MLKLPRAPAGPSSSQGVLRGGVPREEDELTLSSLLLSLTEHRGDQMTVDGIVAHFGRRAFGAALFIFAAPNLLPLPPGSSTVLGWPLLLIAPQLMFGAKDPWLPKRIANHAVGTSFLDGVCRRLAPWVARIERVTTRRLGILFGFPGDILLGFVCTLLAAVLILPLPLGNLIPAIAVTLLGLALAQRDGLLAIAGYVAAAVSAAVLIGGGHLVIAAVMRVVHIITP
jgi:hypothetical protein